MLWAPSTHGSTGNVGLPTHTGAVEMLVSPDRMVGKCWLSGIHRRRGTAGIPDHMVGKCGSPQYTSVQRKCYFPTHFGREKFVVTRFQEILVIRRFQDRLFHDSIKYWSLACCKGSWLSVGSRRGRQVTPKSPGKAWLSGIPKRWLFAF